MKKTAKKSQPKPATAITTRSEQPEPTPKSMLLIAAATPGMSPETIGKFMDLQDRWEAKQAKKAFDEDMAGLQSVLPIIKKSKPGGKTNSGVVAYYYAPIDAIVAQVGPLISRYGFSYRIVTGTRDGKKFADCIVKHKLGHTETTPFDVSPMTGTAVMSASQVDAAAFTYAKRYAFCNAFGIMTGDEDNDAASKPAMPLTEKSAYDLAMETIGKESRPSQLIRIRERVNEHPELTNQQKIKLMSLINAKLKPAA